ncbi:MAG: hypothetical protein KAJ29_03505, partial [Alphaproteobacteria bacterium]|nr:hypothetical protein [Alphaproteobacteria bacterium]
MDNDDLSAIEKEVSTKLGALVSEGIKNIFDDACIIVHDFKKLKSSYNFITHAMREIRSAIKDDVGLHIASVRVDLNKYPKTEKLENGKKKEVLSDNGKIQAICDALDISLTEEQTKFWKNGFHSLAHRKGLQKSKEVDKEFIDQVWKPFLVVLRKTLVGIEEAFSEYYKQAEIIARKPTKKNVGVLLQKIPNDPHIRDHFFKSAEDPDWLELLEKNSIFYEPTDIIEHEEGSISFPYWPATDFLKKLAANKLLPEEKITLIEDIIGKIPECDNPSVNRQIIEVLLELPAQNSSNLVSRIKKIIDGKYFYSWPTEISALIIRLQKGEFHEAANEIIHHLVFDKRFDEFLDDRYTFSSSDMRLYYIDEMHKVIASSKRTKPETIVFDLFSDRLFDTLSKSFEGSETEGYYTKYWQQPFYEKERGGEILEVFTSCCTVSANMLVAKNKKFARYVIKTLLEKNKSPQWDIVKRLILYLLEKNPVKHYETIRQELASELEKDEELRSLNAQNSGGFVVYKSLYSDEDLAKLSPAEIIQIILKYDGLKKSFLGEEPCRHGLMEAVERQAQKRPDDFLNSAKEIKKLSDSDISSILYAISRIEDNESIKNKNGLIELGHWFITERYQDASENVRRNFAHSMENILRRIYVPNASPIACNSKSWKILTTIMNDPMGLSILDSSRKDKFYNLANHAINTPSTEAFECLLNTYFVPGIKYATLRDDKDFEAFKTFMEEEISKNNDPAFRWVCGEYINSFLCLDEQWTKETLQPLLFDKSNDDAWQAFVAGMLTQKYVCNDVFKEHYSQAVDLVSEQSDEDEDPDNFSIENGLARHMSFVYCSHNKETIDDENTITYKIFTQG